ncbi:hypothetical protein B0H63DRAFT_394535 [Podospora didyma]|uniref:HAUS augmin-like complex subunit 1 n=1 Tax=Podospora didyma TaxID=330526 RepID=A0AAE0NNE8_9PEZI|nr:hypothetical protein B0H63DRAFT_394535 [Podospora didyma]
MAHLPSSAIFSPSVARAAASTAADWNFVDSWLARKFPARSPPAFERNSETLRALLALASANEAADEERALLCRLEASALAELEQQRTQSQLQSRDASISNGSDPADDAREAILAQLQDHLSREGQVALSTMAILAVDVQLSFASPADIGAAMVSTAGEIQSVSQAEARIAILARYISSEALENARLADMLTSGDEFRPAADLAKQNLETQRKIKAMAARLPELRDRVAALASSVGGLPSPTVDQVRQEEETYLALLAQKKELDAQVKSFQGLPPDTNQARQELETLRNELRRITQRRDAVFEGLVERETPRKSTR